VPGQLAVGDFKLGRERGALLGRLLTECARITRRAGQADS